MVTIYVLINPLNNEPFYVGSTKRKLKDRLSGHLHGAEGVKEKQALITLLKSSNLKPEIMTILICSEKAAIKCEKHVYKLLIEHGYTLHQEGARIQRNNI